MGLGLLALTGIAFMQKRLHPGSGSEDGSSASAQFSSSVRGRAALGTLVQAQKIVGLTVNSTPSQPLPETVAFVVEGVRSTHSGFQILFSIWNMTNYPIKVFEFVSEEYAGIPSTQYWGGPRSELHLKRDEKSTLWNGRTDEIPAGKSTSFDLKYIVDTGPADGDPWVVLGLHARFHNFEGEVQVASSDSVFLYRSRQCFAVRPQELSSLRDLTCQAYPERTVQNWAERIHKLVSQSLETHAEWQNR